MFRDSVPDGSLQRSRVISMVAPTWCHGANWGNPVWGDCWRFDCRIDTFNLIIRLGKGQQSAFLLISLYDVPLLLWSHVKLWELLFCQRHTVPNNLKPRFYCSFSLWSETWHERQKATGMSSSGRYGLFGIWWGWTYCASNSMELERLFMPLRHDLTTVPKGSNARLLL